MGFLSIFFRHEGHKAASQWRRPSTAEGFNRRALPSHTSSTIQGILTFTVAKYSNPEGILVFFYVDHRLL
jgi:hypothetical protein